MKQNRTKDGVAISFDNSGIVEPNEEVMKIIGGSPDMKTVPFGMNSGFYFSFPLPFIMSP